VNKFYFDLLLNVSVFDCAGYGVGYDDVVIHGSLDDLKFAAFYTKCVSLLSSVDYVILLDLNV